MGRVVAVEGLCTLSAADDKNTVRVEVDLGDSGLRYTPGDALGVWPSNCPQVGGSLQTRLSLEPVAVHVHAAASP
jgi:sulfite reductase (NADPH) flavoprotein alpha-component